MQLAERLDFSHRESPHVPGGPNPGRSTWPSFAPLLAPCFRPQGMPPCASRRGEGGCLLQIAFTPSPRGSVMVGYLESQQARHNPQ